jgi:hypothetical protein
MSLDHTAREHCRTVDEQQTRSALTTVIRPKRLIDRLYTTPSTSFNSCMGDLAAGNWLMQQQVFISQCSAVLLPLHGCT